MDDEKKAGPSQDEIARLKRIEREERIKVTAASRRNPRKGKTPGASPRNILFSVVLALFIVILGSIGYIYITEYMPNYNHMSFYEKNPGLDQLKSYIIFNNELITDTSQPEVIKGELCLPVDFVRGYLDTYIFWDPAVKRLTITPENRVIRIRANELSYFENERQLTLAKPVYDMNGTAYLPKALLTELYNIEMVYAEKYSLMIVDTLDEPRSLSEVVKKTELRTEADRKSPILENLAVGEGLTVYEREGDYILARTKDGIVGYALYDSLRRTETLPAVEKTGPDIEFPALNLPDGRITLAWDQDFVQKSDVENGEDSIVNVYAPTWFSFDAEALDGRIISLADADYVELAHKKDARVWALISDNFDGDVSHKILTDTEAREGVINQLLDLTEAYSLDGINIDFEMVRQADAEYYILFLRELYPLLRLRGVVLSVDMYVPKPYNLYYNRTEVAKTSDFIIVMGFDEHHATSEVSGPVASIDFVDEGIYETIREAVPSKVVIGLPLYVRVWREEKMPDGSVSVSSRSYSMDRGKKIFDDAGAEFEWLEDIGSYYAEYEMAEDGGGVKYRVWLEDLRSFEEKLKLLEKYKLAGMAAWKLGLEADGVWDLVKKYNK